MALIYLGKADSRLVGKEYSAAQIHELERTLTSEPAAKASSLPILPTHKVSLHSRACYKHYGATPDELRKRVKDDTVSFSEVDEVIEKRDRRRELNVKTSITTPYTSATEEGVTPAVSWTVYRVTEWIRELGYAKYIPCFKENHISGRKLILFRELNNFPKIGITDFDDMKSICKSVQKLLNVRKPTLYQYMLYTAGRSIAWPDEEVYEMYLQEKANTGRHTDMLTYSQYRDLYKERHDRAWDVPDNSRKWRKHKEP